MGKERRNHAPAAKKKSKAKAEDDVVCASAFQGPSQIPGTKRGKPSDEKRLCVLHSICFFRLAAVKEDKENTALPAQY